MSAVLGVFAPGGPPPGRVLEGMMAAMRRRGTEHRHVRRGDGWALSIGRFGWELGPETGTAEVVGDGDLWIAADATLYYRRELIHSLAGRGVRPEGSTASRLILASYQAWGTGCTEHLEGDFAFVLFDTRRRLVLCARDHAATRPLFHARVGDALVVASTISAVLAYPGCPTELNLAVVAEDAAGLNGSASETCYRAVGRLTAGTQLVCELGGSPRISPYWTYPRFDRDDVRGSFSREDQAELRHLLSGAVSERLAARGDTSVWLSGGYDSSAVYASAKSLLREAPDGRRIRPVSISYPPGDPGREDEQIRAIAEHWGDSATWVDVTGISLLDDLDERAAGRDEAYGHRFEPVLRALARASAHLGSHVSLDGTGGDQLFQVGTGYLADLLRAGRWSTLSREWRSRGLRGRRRFLRVAVQPNVPQGLLTAITRLGGGAELRRNYLERPLPDWIDAGFARKHALVERERAHLPPRAGRGTAEYETLWTLSAPLFERLNAYLSAFALEAGVERRAPFYDARLIRFAAGRPRWERNSMGEIKRLLRSAMRGLLPDGVLAPRLVKTGRAHGYLSRSVATYLAGVDPDDPAGALVELGIADRDAFRRLWRRFRQDEDMTAAVQLSTALSVEAWLRARVDPGDHRSSPGMPERQPLALCGPRRP
jgi:asparagine synthase (glutamine-hydrolysing)